MASSWLTLSPITMLRLLSREDDQRPPWNGRAMIFSNVLT
jgi:hypothetical protein